MKVKVSIIIPVFNAESFIASCIESLLRQTLQECEFIFVNDGSTDNSRFIIEQYAELDKRIKVIHQQNKGVSSARNTGLKAAFGEYVGFVDADDYVKEDMYEKLYTTCAEGNYDGVISNFESEIEGHYIITDYPFRPRSYLGTDYIRKYILPYFLKSDNLNTVCSKLYKHKVIKEHDIYFPEGVALGEDGLFNLHFISSASRLIYLDYTGYHYREVEGSATRNIKEKDYFKRALEVYTLHLPKRLMGDVDSDTIKELKSIRLINSVMSYIHVYFNPEEKLNYRKRALYIKRMISNEHVREALLFFYRTTYPSMGKYDKWMIRFITAKSVTGLFFMAAYSRMRNKSKGGIKYENVNVRS